jgi:hypothetical protein
VNYQYDSLGIRTPYNSSYSEWIENQFKLKHEYETGKMDPTLKRRYRIYKRYMNAVAKNGYNYRSWKKYQRDIVNEERKYATPSKKMYKVDTTDPWRGNVFYMPIVDEALGY